MTLHLSQSAPTLVHPRRVFGVWVVPFGCTLAPWVGVLWGNSHPVLTLIQSNGSEKSRVGALWERVHPHVGAPLCSEKTPRDNFCIKPFFTDNSELHPHGFVKGNSGLFNEQAPTHPDFCHHQLYPCTHMKG